MALIPIIVLLAGAGTASFVLGRRLQAKKQLDTSSKEETSDATTQEATQDTSSDLGQLWTKSKSWYMTLTNQTPTDLPQHFREWAVDATDDTTIKDWLNALSDNGLQAYTKHLASFCSDMGFELTWLVEKQLDKNPELYQSAQRIVLHYCQACQQAASAQENLEAHKQLQSLETNPSSRKNQAFGEKLFAKIVEANLVTSSMPEFISASPKERRQRIVDAIGAASTQHPNVFNRMVKDVLRDISSEAAAATPEPAAASEPSASVNPGTEAEAPA